MTRWFLRAAALTMVALPLLTIGGLTMAKDEVETADALAFDVKTIDGSDATLGDYQGKVVLIVNVASKCGLTPQYEGLEAIYQKYKDQGLVVLGFPCNQFGGQEPGSEEDIKEFCTTKYKVTFPMFSKIEVNGEGAAPLYKYLTARKTSPISAGDISWNFEKFLIGRDGELIARFSPRTKPSDTELVEAVETALAAK